MNKIIMAIVVCFVILQVEILGLFWLDGMNLRLWNSQVKLNGSIVEVCTQ